MVRGKDKEKVRQKEQGNKKFCPWLKRSEPN